MEEFYIERLLEYSKRLPVIKQFLLLLLDYTQLEKYCFCLFDIKEDVVKLLLLAITEGIEIPWSVLVVDKYKWDVAKPFGWYGKKWPEYDYGPYMCRNSDAWAFNEIIGDRNNNVVRGLYAVLGEYRFSKKEKRYIRLVLKDYGRGRRLIDNYILHYSLRQIFKGKQKIDCLRGLYKVSIHIE